MSRTAVYQALVLRNRASGESNSEITMLTSEEGIIRATVFGGAKSKLRAHSAPYNSGQVWIYRDPAKDYAKISDFDVQSWRPGLRELYERSMTAGAVAETILSSHGGGGEWAQAQKLALETLDTLESANEELCQKLLIHFLWRWSGFLGIQPRLENCAACDRDASAEPLWFSVREGAAFCGDCAHEQQGLLRLDSGCRRWLALSGQLEPSALHRYSMDNKSFAEAKSLVTSVVTGALGKRLAVWDW
ncbi:MAG: DNA repair protein RecO [Treponema sp.]|jgi:DNA repair protein RecO (recombination protein O)|nr:DNA repair protein RecO [Treponema sp.]